MSKSRKSSVKKLSVSRVRRVKSQSKSIKRELEDYLGEWLNHQQLNLDLMIETAEEARDDQAGGFLAGMKDSQPLTLAELVDLVRVIAFWSDDFDALVLGQLDNMNRSYLCIQVVEVLSRHFEIDWFNSVVNELVDSDLTQLDLFKALSVLNRMV